MKPIEAYGHWWLPQATDERVHGRFTFTLESNAIVLELDRPLTGWVDLSDGYQTWEMSETAYPLVHGELVDGRSVTVVQARAGISVGGPTELRSSYALLGPYVVDDPRFTHIHVELDWLDSWLNLSALVDFPRGHVVEAEIASERVVEVALGDGTTVALTVEMDGRADADRVDLTRRTYFEVDLLEATGLAGLLADHVRPLQDLTTVALGVPVRAVGIRATPVGDEAKLLGLLDVLCPLNQASQETDTRPERLASYYSATLLSGQQLLDDFETLVPGWYACKDSYSGTVSKLDAASYARFMYLENRAALAVQAVEALHKVEFSGRDLSKEEHKLRHRTVVGALQQLPIKPEWVGWAAKVLPQRNDASIPTQIARIFDLAGEFGAYITDQVPDLAAGAAKLRNLSSHGSASASIGMAEDYERAYFLTEMVRWALRVVLLIRAGHAGAPDLARRAAPVTFALGRLRDLGALPSTGK